MMTNIIIVIRNIVRFKGRINSSGRRRRQDRSLSDERRGIRWCSGGGIGDGGSDGSQYDHLRRSDERRRRRLCGSGIGDGSSDGSQNDDLSLSDERR